MLDPDPLDQSAAKAEKPAVESPSRWWRRADPLTVAILTGALTLLGNMLVSFYNNRSNIAQEIQKAADDQRLEEKKAKYSLVLQAMTTNDAAVAKRNIHFFIDAGLLPDDDCKIREAIDQDQPVLPSLSGVAPNMTGGIHSPPRDSRSLQFSGGLRRARSDDWDPRIWGHPQSR